jgi:uncharacterized repeat protein (TIGR02543 family)
MTNIRKHSGKLGLGALSCFVIFLFAVVLLITCAKVPDSDKYCGPNDEVVGSKQKCKDGTVYDVCNGLLVPVGTVCAVEPPDTATPPTDSVKYKVVVSSAGTGATGAGKYSPKDTVKVTAGTPKSGYQFKKWTSADSVKFIPNADSSTVRFVMPARDVTVTAVFDTTSSTTEKKYNVKVVSEGTGAAGGGEYSPYVMVTVKAGTPQSGYRFKEWTSSADDIIFVPDSSIPNVLFSMPAKDVTVTAVFEPIPVTKKYPVAVSSAGTGATGDSVYAAGDTVKITAGTPQSGYQFKEWTSSVDSVKLKFAPSANNATVTFIMPDTAVTVTAVFEEIAATAHTITFNAGGGGTVTPASGATDATGRLANLPTPTKTGYAFIGWFTADTASDTSNTRVTAGATGTVFNANAVIYARWTLTTYTITYTLAGGTVATANPANYTVETDTIKLKNPTRNGWTFVGWTGANGTTPDTAVTIAKGSTGAKTYTANWIVTTYTITYNLAGGTLAVADTNRTTYTIETAAFKLKNPTRNGYTFAGWTGANGTTADTSVSVARGNTGDKTYTANWTVITYTITYTLDGGTVATPNPANYTVETPTFVLNNPTKAGHTFKGWTGSNVTTLQTTVAIAMGSTGDKTYTANWITVPTYTLTLASNPTDGGDVAISGGTAIIKTGITAGEQVSIIATVKEGYTFKNWTISPDTAASEILQTDNRSTVVIVNDTVTVTANFQPDPSNSP